MVAASEVAGAGLVTGKEGVAAADAGFATGGAATAADGVKVACAEGAAKTTFGVVEGVGATAVDCAGVAAKDSAEDAGVTCEPPVSDWVGATATSD